MSPTASLVAFSWCLIITLVVVVLTPYFRGKADLVTGRNIFLLGAVNFMGFAGVKAGSNPDYFKVLQYARSDYQLFMAGAATFLVCMLLAYHYIKFPRAVAGSFPRAWPPMTTPVLYVMLGAAITAAVASLLPIPIVGVAQFIRQVGNKGIAFAVVIAFIAWTRQKNNPLLLSAVVGTLLLAVIMSVMSGGGRRTLVGVGVAIPITYYWTHLRYKTLTRTVVTLGIASASLILIILAYSQVRHFDRRGEKKARTFSNAAQVLTKLPEKVLTAKEGADSVLGQNAAQTSLAAIHIYTKREKPEPFHTLYYVSTIAIPRSLWEDKPKGLGYTLPKTARAVGTRATWGPGIVGHGFHEGGLHMLIFYGVLAGMALRYLDELLMRQPSNPYLLGALAASSGHILGWTRGDIGTFTVQVLTSFLAGYLVGVVGRICFGSGAVYPKTSSSAFTSQNLYEHVAAAK